jgi:hypothetical protein
MQIHECHILVVVQVAHGNEDTFREMLRIRRSVAASFSQTHFNTTIIDAATAPVTTGQCLLLKLSNIIRYYQKTSHR